MVRLYMTSEHEVINPTIVRQPYECSWIFEEAEQPAACEMTTIVGDEEPKKTKVTFEREGTYFRASLGKREIEPRTKGVRYRFSSKCTCLAPKSWFHTTYFGLPTIDVTISVSGPEGWTVWVDGDKTRTLHHESGLRMTGDKFSVHWTPPAA
jgi:hypothetical protein